MWVYYRHSRVVPETEQVNFDATPRPLEQKPLLLPATTHSASAAFSSAVFWSGKYETGNYLELTRVEDFYLKAFPVSVTHRISTSDMPAGM